MKVRLMTGRQLKAHLLVASAFAASAGERDALGESAYRTRTLREHPRRALWVRTPRFALAVPLPARRPRRIVITALQ